MGGQSAEMETEVRGRGDRRGKRVREGKVAEASLA